MSENINPLWNLVDPLTVEPAAALVAQVDPNLVIFSSQGGVSYQGNSLRSDDICSEVKTVFIALTNAINAGDLKATIRRSAWQRGYDEDPGPGEMVAEKIRLEQSDIDEATEGSHAEWCRLSGSIIYRVSPDWKLTTVARIDLENWLRNRGIRTGFFFPNSTDTPDYLDPQNPRYAPKLAAAVRAWQAVTDPKGKAGAHEVASGARGGIRLK